MQQTIYNIDHSLELPHIKQVSSKAPFQWLASGWQDYLNSPWSSSFYGLVFVLLGYAVTAATWQSPILVMTFVTGFFLIAPFLALGLYDLSRQREQAGKASLGKSLFAFNQNKRDMALLVVFHALIMIAWIRITSLMSALYVTNTGTSITVLTEQIWSGAGIQMLVLFALSGAVLAALVFVTSVVSWPMILDRNRGVINAIATSIKTVTHNKRPMLVWAILIGLLFTVGVATLYVGLLFIIPVLGHATWHAYKDLVQE